MKSLYDLLNLQYRLLIASVFKLMHGPGRQLAGAANWSRRNGQHIPKCVTAGLYSSFSFPLTVSAWSLNKKKGSENTSGFRLLSGGVDSMLLEDMKAADLIYVTGQMNKNDEIYERLHTHRDKNEPELLWRLARSTYEKSKKVEDPTQKRLLTEEALILARKAQELDDENFAVHKWIAILLNESSKLHGTKEQIKQSFNVKFHMERALELNPKDATSAYLLGQWCFSVAEVPWYQQKIAAAIFATPPTSSYDDALKYFLQAEEIQPHFYSMNLLMLAKTYLKLGNVTLARVYLDQLTELPMKTEEDFLARKEGRQIRNKISQQSEQLKNCEQISTPEDK